MTAVAASTFADDMELVRRCKAEDELACSELFRAYSQRIYGLACRILKDESAAEDALQETFVNVFNGIKRFRGEARISTWINRIALNVCLGMIRRNRHQRFVDLESVSAKDEAAEPDRFDPLEQASRQEIRRRVNRALELLDDKHRAVVYLHDIEGHTIDEIARMLGCPAGTVKSRLFYGRKEFKRIFSSLWLNRG